MMNKTIDCVDIIFDDYKCGTDDYRVRNVFKSTQATSARIWNQGAEPWVEGAKPVAVVGKPIAAGKDRVAVFASAYDLDSGIEWVVQQAKKKPEGDFSQYGVLINSGIAMADLSVDQAAVREQARSSYKTGLDQLAKRKELNPEIVELEKTNKAKYEAESAYRRALEAVAAKELISVASWGGDVMKSGFFFSTLGEWAAAADNANSISSGESVAKALESLGFAKSDKVELGRVEPGSEEASRILCASAIEMCRGEIPINYGLASGIGLHTSALNASTDPIAEKIAARRAEGRGLDAREAPAIK
jgi:hypothetical protein